MSDLLNHPLWEADSLGSPLPDNEFGVSVSLPQWRHVIGYEEGDAAVVSQFRSGYPRFCCPPAISSLFEAAERAFGQPGERALVFPRVSHAQRCLDFIARNGFSGRTVEWGDQKLGVALFPADAYVWARKAWRFCGEVVSTRQAAHVLGHTSSQTTEAEGLSAVEILKQRLADFTGQQAEDVFLFPSGMAANFAVHRMLTELAPGCRTVQLDFPYVDVLKLQQTFGSGAHFLPLADEAEYEDLQRLLTEEKMAGLFCEAPSNPLLRCVDLPKLLAIRTAAQPNVPLIIDDTLSTPVNADALSMADLTTSSLTKTFSGAGDVLAGSVILSRRSPHHRTFSAWMKTHAENTLWREDAVALEQNSRDFAERVHRSSNNAQALASWLEGHPKVAQVWHGHLTGGPGYEAIRRKDGGYGCLFSFLLQNAEVASPRFYDALRVCKGPSLGTNFTLVCPYTLLAHYEELEWAESCGVPRYLIRVSAGLEDVDDLVSRFEEALRAA